MFGRFCQSRVRARQPMTRSRTKHYVLKRALLGRLFYLVLV